MIIGIGNDIIEIERIENAIKKESFLKRYFTQNELNLFSERHFRAETIAGSFSAKEAFAKALGTGFSAFEAIDIEILHDEKGKPILNVFGNAFNKVNELDICKIHVSISHCSKYATSFVICEGGNN